MKLLRFKNYSFPLWIALVLVSIEAAAQNKEIRVESQTYEVTIDQRTSKIGLYLINGAPYGRVEDLVVAFKGTSKEFNLKMEREQRDFDQPRDVYHLTTSSPYSVLSAVKPATMGVQKAYTSRSYLYVDDYQRPTTPYVIGKNDYFKVDDLMRILDLRVTTNTVNRTIKIETAAFYQVARAKTAESNRAQAQWVKVPANIGMGVAKLNGYYETDAQLILHRRLPNVSIKDDGILMLTHLPTGQRQYLPFDNIEPSYGGVFRGFSEGWCPVYNYFVAMGRDPKGGYVKTRAYTYVNAQGEVLTPKMFFTTARQFQKGYAVVTYLEDGLDYTGVLNQCGEMVMAIPGKYEDAHFNQNILEVSIVCKKDHNFFKEVIYYGVDGQRIPISEKQYAEMESPGYDPKERSAFDKYAAQYKEVAYCGYNRFVIKQAKGVKVVDKNNVEIFRSQSPTLVPIFAWGKLFFRVNLQMLGVIDANGKQVLAPKYTNVIPLNGESFMTIINNREQSIVSLNGQLIASSPNAPLWALDKSELVTLREYLLDSEVIPGDVVMLYSNIDLSKKLSTQRLKSIVSKYKKTNMRYMRPTHQQAVQVAQQPTANALHVLALESYIEGWFESE